MASKLHSTLPSCAISFAGVGSHAPLKATAVLSVGSCGATCNSTCRTLNIDPTGSDEHGHLGRLGSAGISSNCSQLVLSSCTIAKLACHPRSVVRKQTSTVYSVEGATLCTVVSHRTAGVTATVRCPSVWPLTSASDMHVTRSVRCVGSRQQKRQ